MLAAISPGGFGGCNAINVRKRARQVMPCLKAEFC